MASQREIRLTGEDPILYRSIATNRSPKTKVERLPRGNTT
jgi:hypothetical protein